VTLSLGPREAFATLRVLSRGDLARYSTTKTSETTRFERELGAAFGSPHALGVNSGTSALICALVAAGIGPGDEVLVPAYTWVSSAAAPLAVGAIPVLVEIDESLTIDPIDAEQKITSRTKAIIPVHMLNLVCDMEAILAIAKRHELVVVEDACQAIGVRYRGRQAGTIGDAGAYSFNQQKNIKCGEGGALVTSSDSLYERAAMYHDVGSYERADHAASDGAVFPGINARMSELSAAILRPQLKRLDRQIALRQRRRRMVLEHVDELTGFSATVSHHHDPDAAVGIGLRFDDPDDAARFGSTRGARRLSDTGRHVYTNWKSVTGMHPHHPDLDPYKWSDAVYDYSESACPRTLEILSRSCTVETAPELPGPVFRSVLKRLGA
jgi:dTDP-4-amino-4,6-dideoxygalactose transaminase